MKEDTRTSRAPSSIYRTTSLFLRFFTYIGKNKKIFLLNLIVMTAAIVTGAIIIWMVGKGVNALLENELTAMFSYLLGFCSLVVLLQVLRYLNYYLNEFMQQHAIYGIRRKLYSHIMTLSTPYSNIHSSGDLLTRLGNDIVRISVLLVLLPGNAFRFLLTSMFYTAILFYIDPVLAILSVSLAPIFLVHQYFFINKTRKKARQFLYHQGCMGGFEEETLKNIQGINSFNAEKTMLKRFDSLFSKFRNSAMSNLMLNNLFIVTFEFLAAVIAVTIVTIGVYRVAHSHLDSGALINFLLYLGYLIIPVRGLTSLPIESQINAAAAERVATVLDEQPLVTNLTLTDKITATLKNKCPTITISNVNFSYSNHCKILQGLSIKIKPYEFIAIAGSSGAGKTTLAKLLLRFYDPDSGNILWDGNNLKNINLQSLRSQISIVWQEPFLIDDTVTENIRLANPKASIADVIKAATAANADEFIEQLPNGYNTCLSNSGGCLSEGQKQRIALAQAFIKKAPLLILDEATSSLDSHSEMLIMQSFKKIRTQCTTIVVAHRYTTIAAADRIIYLNDDASVIIGTHNQLYNSCPSYRKTVTHQSRAAKGIEPLEQT